jgi:NAD(P)-dependent dehydrogenase (short-subunit alcohol dehydrogenase family)
MMFDFKDQVIVVTGAPGNLGSAVVEKFLESGGTVIGLDHGKGRLESKFRSALEEGTFYSFEEIDVTNPERMLALSQEIEKTIGHPDILVNTVGGFAFGEPVHEISSGTWQRMMDLNVQSLLVTAGVFVPAMLENGRGKIISIGSKASLNGSAKTGAYAAAKSAVLRLTESMAAELKANNIQANCVLPGTIDTPENREAMPDANFAKWVTPEKIAEVILFLSSSSADAVTGAAVPVFGKS